MAEDQSKPETREEDTQTPIDPQQAAAAVREVNEAMAILPRKRFGCLGRIGKYGAVVLVLLAIFVYWNFLRTPRLRISKETTYIVEPLTSDGSRVDYFAAWERDFYPPEMKTDNNGYRLIVRALGDATGIWQADQDYDDAEARVAQVYEKLGLDRTIEPTMTYSDCYDILRRHGESEGLDEKDLYALEYRGHEPWTFDDLPMLKPWLEANTPALDLVGKAARKPTFFMPAVRPSWEETELQKTFNLGEIQRSRSFARMLTVRANYRIGTGDIDGAIHDVISCQRLGQHMRYQGTMVANLVGVALEGIATAIGVAANLDSQPTPEQLQHFADELNAIPPRPDLDRSMLAERYYMLDSLQSVAHSDEPLVALFSALGIEKFKPGIAPYISVDWSIVMQQVNAMYDDSETIQVGQPPTVLSPGNLLISVRSRRVADVVASVWTPTFRACREADLRSSCSGNLQRIALAMLIYQRKLGTLPPAYTVDANDKPLHSWRVLLLPYLGKAELYDQLHLDESWDSKHNRQFHDATVAVYQCPSAELQGGQTTYSVVLGQNTPFQAAKGKSLDLFGTHLILVVERQQPVCWMDPASELTESVALKGINRSEANSDGLGSPHATGLNVSLRNGSALFITETFEPSLLHGLLDGTAEEFPN